MFSSDFVPIISYFRYGVTDRFLKENATKMDVSIEGYYVMKVADRWLSVRLEALGAFIGLGAALLVVVTTVQNREMGLIDRQFVGVAGLSLTYAISVTGLLNWTVRSFAQVRERGGRREGGGEKKIQREGARGEKMKRSSEHFSAFL